MSEHSTKPSTVDDEIDLGVVFGEIKRLFISFLKVILSIFFFLYKHKFVLIILLVVGVVAGYFLDKVLKTNYRTDLTVVTNYSSTDYLYNKIDALEAKIKQKDTVYLEQVFGSKYDLVKDIEIEPILDIYKFISESEENKEIFKLLLDEQDDVDKFLESHVNSYNYPFHRVKLIIKGQNHHKTITNQLLSHINANEYFTGIKDILIENYKQQLIQNKEIINQIDNIIESVIKEQNSSKENLKVSINENQVIDNILQKKKDLLKNDGFLRSQIQNQQEIIKKIDSNYALEYNEKITDKDKKYLLPLFLISLYLLFYLFKYVISKSKRFYTP
ncbi:hypothetical protein [Flavobacterium sp. CS20]|uniref:hypothetical protein n=1 Tax=Flavobacterium sp. CS20 TaxID=2775246 RepID=UPI001B39FCB4|nr:hypothetical protein [Flavobacterium sp. CS20]QTY26391.1 hypothetical protein IGB25_10630 [Flavobacterium sp. CS20]